jgi:hypothetical protein
MFATAGTLNPENDETFDDHRDDILKTAKALVEDTKTLVAGAASSQEQLAVAAQNAVATIVQLSDVVKLGAASLGSNNQEAQVAFLSFAQFLEFWRVETILTKAFCFAGHADQRRQGRCICLGRSYPVYQVRRGQERQGPLYGSSKRIGQGETSVFDMLLF